MTNKYNVQLITDVNGKPMPQYYDESEGVMKPITRDNGEITGDVNANVSFPETQNVNGTVSVDNFPQTQQVEVTNQKEVQDVNVTNQATSVDVNNFPELQDVSDEQVRAELEQIKATQSQILERLDNPIDTQLTGSNVEKGLPVQVEKDFIEVEVSFEELAEGKNAVIDVYSNEGEIWTLKRLGYLILQDSSATGTHFIWFYHGDSSSNANFMMSINGNADKYIRGTIPGRRESSFGGDISPSDPFEMVTAIKDTTVLSHSLPVRIRYSNRADRSLPGGYIKLFFQVEKVNNV